MNITEQQKNKLTVVSLFAGCGGSSLGYKMAGCDVRLAVEWDKHACDIYRHNFPDTPLYQGDIVSLDQSNALSMAQLEPKQLDILDGSPPCQGFSMVGQRILNDDRNQLFREYIRMLNTFQPKSFVMENVSGLAKGKMKLVLAEILRELKACGYRVVCRVLNAWWYGVPQSRQRVFIVGLRNDMNVEPSHPKPNTSKPVTFRQATSDLVNTAHELAEAMIPTTWQMYRVLTGKEKHRHFGLIRLVRNKPSATIVKDCGNTTTGMIYPDELRKLTISELKRLHSYPDSFEFFGSFKDKWARIGNSVPPLMTKAIGTHLATLVS